MSTYTRVQRIQQTDAYKSGEWFNSGQLAQSLNLPADDVRTVLAQNKDLFESKRVSGKALLYRKKKNITVLNLRKRYFDWEKEVIHPYQPRWR